MALFQSPLCSSTFNGTEASGQLNRSWHLEEIAAARQQQLHNPETGRSSSTCTQVVWIFFWLTILITVAYPIAFIAGLLYVILNPLSLCNCSQPLMNLLMVGLKLPASCAKNMVDAKQLIVM